MPAGPLEASYGPQPYDRTQGGPVVFHGTIQDTEATGVMVEVSLFDARGGEVFRGTVEARNRGNGRWEFSLPWTPPANLPDGDYGPTFRTTRRYGGQPPVTTEEQVCSGIALHRGSARWVALRGGPTGPTGGPGNEREAATTGGEEKLRRLCRDFPWLPVCWGIVPWQWRKDPRLEESGDSTGVTGGGPPPIVGPIHEVTPPTPRTGSLLAPGFAAAGDGPGGACRR